MDEWVEIALKITGTLMVEEHVGCDGRYWLGRVGEVAATMLANARTEGWSRVVVRWERNVLIRLTGVVSG